jgi:hypothetical protein
MAAEVVAQTEWFSWSLNQLAREFGIARETVQARLRACDIKPSGERRGFPVYRVSEAAKAILVQPQSIGAAMSDPDRMTPKERSDWFKSENERLKYERDSGIAVDSNAAREQMAVIAKTGLQVLETLPDILERDFAIDAKIISSVEAKIDVLREQWANLIDEADV